MDELPRDVLYLCMRFVVGFIRPTLLALVATQVQQVRFSKKALMLALAC